LSGATNEPNCDFDLAQGKVIIKEDLNFDWSSEAVALRNRVLTNGLF
jgi:hypothetical protein